MKKIALILLIISQTLLVAGCSFQNTEVKPVNPLAKEEASFIVTANTHMLQTLDKNIFGNKTPEKMILYVEETPEGMPQSWSLVVDGVEKVKLFHEDGLYSFAKLALADIDNDQRDEVLLYRQSSGSAGAMGLNVYKASENNLQQIFSNENEMNPSSPRFEVKYMGDYYVKFEDKETGLKAVIELDQKQYSNLEDMLNNIATWIDPIADYSLVDYNDDGIKEIITIQRVIGISHADTIGLLKTTFKMDQNQYKATTLTLCDSKDKPLAEVKL
ncbi:hypothetical protein [Desulfotomaculum sp. 1211_IL3151]|uniref:hypothetical protein n=1 Tax=Desulfotomaculum sp. 1211_IL3151 TaxID=3084055 RepID=UPI002FD90F7F